MSEVKIFSVVEQRFVPLRALKPFLQTMVNIARTIPGVIGERMLGGGDKAIREGADRQVLYRVLKWKER